MLQDLGHIAGSRKFHEYVQALDVARYQNPPDNLLFRFC